MKFFGLGCASKKIASQVVNANRPTFQKVYILAPAIQNTKSKPQGKQMEEEHKHETCNCFQ